MTVSALICLANGSEETEAVTTIDLLVRGGFKVTVAAVNNDGSLVVYCSRGVGILADTTLSAAADTLFDVVVLPGGAKGAASLSENPQLAEVIKHTHAAGKLVAAICAAPALVLQRHHLFPHAAMTCFPALKASIPPDGWRDQRVVFDQSANLLTSQGPGTSMDFALKIIELLAGHDKAADVAAQLVLPGGIDDYRR